MGLDQQATHEALSLYRDLVDVVCRVSLHSAQIHNRSSASSKSKVAIAIWVIVMVMISLLYY